ncbi:MAG: hypothetical protein GY702_21930 [Desulfobulbaceae bacterium]|nr:hypothetical protein [Desulfobulbaceae bacterium]
MKQSRLCRLGIVCLCLLSPIQIQAGSIDSPAAPTDSGSAMHTLNDLYNQANTGAVNTKRTGAFVEPTSGPGSSTRTVDEIQAVLPTPDNIDGALPSEVESGKKYWGLRTDGSWGLQSGSLPNIGQQDITPGATNQSINQGYHDGTGIVDGDVNLTGGNIKSGVTIFGVAGDNNVVDTSSGDATATHIVSSKKAWVDGNEVTGSLTTQILSETTTMMNGGYYEGTTLEAVDSDLAAENIKSGVTIFGVTGSSIGTGSSSGSKRGCSTYLIPYMPYSVNTYQIIYMSRVPASWVGEGANTASDISVEAMDDSGALYDLGVIGSLDPGITKLSTLIMDKLVEKGFESGKVAIKMSVSNPETVLVYASYTVGGSERSFVEVKCLR